METNFFNDKYDFIETAYKVLNGNDRVEFNDNNQIYLDAYTGKEIITVNDLENGKPFYLNNTLFLFQEARL